MEVMEMAGAGAAYRECLKNHAANLGSYATDGCGEFMEAAANSPDYGSLRCVACGCHRNFHRKVVSVSRDEDLDYRRYCSLGGEGAQEAGGRKRFRTKFSAAQKDRMTELAEKIGWRMQKEEEAAIQAFCKETGIPRRVFKVWMHNHKSSSANASPHPVETIS